MICFYPHSRKSPTKVPLASRRISSVIPCKFDLNGRSYSDLMWAKQVINHHKPPIWEWFIPPYTTYKNGEIGGWFSHDPTSEAGQVRCRSWTVHWALICGDMMDMCGIYVLKFWRKIDIFQSACTKQLSIDSYWFASQRYSTDDNENARNTAPRRYYRQQLRQIFSIKNDTMDKLKAKGEKIFGLTW